MKGFVEWLSIFNGRQRNLKKIVDYYRKSRETRLYTSVAPSEYSLLYQDPVLGLHVFAKGMNNTEGKVLVREWDRLKSAGGNISQLDIFDFILKFNKRTALEFKRPHTSFSVQNKIPMQDIAMKVEFLWERELEISSSIRLGKIYRTSKESQLINVLNFLLP